jgi:hypothetical protein
MISFLASIRPWWRRAIVLLALLFVLGWNLPAVRAAPASALAEYRIKGAYLYNFTKFVEWPPRAFAAAGAPLVVGIVGPDSDAAAAVAGVLAGKKTGAGRPIEVRRFEALDEPALHCQLLFVLHGAAPDAAAVKAALDARPILAVGETDGFAEHGGTVNFVRSGDAIRFEINPGRAERAGLKVSGRLASVARLVRDLEED